MMLVTVHQGEGLPQVSSMMPHLLVGLRLRLDGLLVRLQPVQQRIHLLLSLDVGILLLCSQLSLKSLHLTRHSVTQLLQMAPAGNLRVKSTCPFAKPGNIVVSPPDTQHSCLSTGSTAAADQAGPVQGVLSSRQTADNMWFAGSP